MIRTIAYKEWLEITRDGRFRASAGAVLLLLLAALIAGTLHYNQVSREHHEAQRTTREQFLSQGRKNPHSAAHYGMYAFKPKLPLSLADRGTDAYTGVAVWLEAHRQNEFRYRPAQDASSFGRFGELTAATVLQIFVPLLIVATAFPAFAGERENGTLRQLLSVGITRRDLAFGKAAGIGMALGATLVPAALVGAAALVLSAESGAASASFERALLLAASYVLYFCTVLAISLAVSAWVRTARTALLTLLTFWIATCIIAPRLISDAAKVLYPAPNVYEFNVAVENEIRNGIDGHSPQSKRTAELTRGLLIRHGVSRPEDLPFNLQGYLLEEGERYGNLVFDRHFGRLWDTYEAQNRVLDAAALLSPALAVRSLSMAFAGTDFAHHRRFADAAERYRRAMVTELNGAITRTSRTGTVVLAAGELWSRVPPFTYTAPGVGWALGGRAIAVGMLLLWAGAAWFLALRAATKATPL
ncbi:MAG TPA: DUF3526 domain-containing protein [Bryobacteraceae bacterium]|nr:DUF3526 domain-containing protein [Bryobacteraceae bacterium]